MRKLFWLAAVCLVASAGAVYMGAAYASRHPDSWLGRCVTATTCKGMGCVGGSLVGAVHQVVSTTARDADLTAVSSSKLTLLPTPDECPQVSLCPPAAEACEPIQVSMPDQPPGFTPAQPGQDGCQGIAHPGCDLPPGAVAFEECEPPSQPVPSCPVCEPREAMVMPTCMDDSTDQDSPMPYVADEPENKEDTSPFSAWFSWLTQGSGKNVVGHKESDLVPATPSVPQPYPAGMAPSTPLDPPNCMEDPGYSHQYPGCPHMGGCPFGPCCPPMDGVTPPDLKKDKKHVNAEHQAHFLPQQSGEDQAIRPCDVDTMECRPSDIKTADYDPDQPY